MEAINATGGISQLTNKLNLISIRIDLRITVGIIDVPHVEGITRTGVTRDHDSATIRTDGERIEATVIEHRGNLTDSVVAIIIGFNQCDLASNIDFAIRGIIIGIFIKI